MKFRAMTSFAARSPSSGPWTKASRRALVHLAVVDPGVGTDRRILVAEINRQMIVCPDNGLITWSLAAAQGRASCATNSHGGLQRSSDTFHGRDIIGTSSRHDRGGLSPSTNSRRPIDPAHPCSISTRAAIRRQGCVIHIDHFGNATTNILHDSREKNWVIPIVKVGGQTIGKLRRTLLGCDARKGAGPHRQQRIAGDRRAGWIRGRAVGRASRG